MQILIAACGSLHAATPYLGGALGIITVCWIHAARALSKQFVQKSAEMDAARSEESLQK